MLLSALLEGIIALPISLDIEIQGLTLDSRKVSPGMVFMAVPGTKTDGKNFILPAIEQGACAVLAEQNEQETISRIAPIPIIAIKHLSQKIAFIAARFYGFPAEKLAIIGVTGTNGKTSCTHFIGQLLSTLTIPCGVIGTLGYGRFGKLHTTNLTTPDAITLQAILAQFVQQGIKVVAMEVSSHSIAQERINGVPFALAIFTNLSQDHLDYHGTMPAYAAVKQRFLAAYEVKQALINVDDQYGAKWQASLAKHKPIYTYSLTQPSQIYATDIELSLQGIQATLHSPWGNGQASIPLVGRFNLYNVLAAVSAVSLLLNVPVPDILPLLMQLQPIAGRMQLIRAQCQPLVVVDYSHTPDSLANALQALKLHTPGKLYCIFGCGGDRDRGKRPLMGAIAEQWADVVMVTSDNPRSENPQAIIADIIIGFKQANRIYIEPDRRQAITDILVRATTNDCVLIAGKGAEQYQILVDKTVPFNDAEEVRTYFATVACPDKKELS